MAKGKTPRGETYIKHEVQKTKDFSTFFGTKTYANHLKMVQSVDPTALYIPRVDNLDSGIEDYIFTHFGSVIACAEWQRAFSTREKRGSSKGLEFKVTTKDVFLGGIAGCAPKCREVFVENLQIKFNSREVLFMGKIATRFMQDKTQHPHGFAGWSTATPNEIRTWHGTMIPSFVDADREIHEFMSSGPTTESERGGVRYRALLEYGNTIRSCLAVCRFDPEVRTAGKTPKEVGDIVQKAEGAPIRGITLVDDERVGSKRSRTVVAVAEGTHEDGAAAVDGVKHKRRRQAIITHSHFTAPTGKAFNNTNQYLDSSSTSKSPSQSSSPSGHNDSYWQPILQGNAWHSCTTIPVSSPAPSSRHFSNGLPNPTVEYLDPCPTASRPSPTSIPGSPTRPASNNSGPLQGTSELIEIVEREELEEDDPVNVECERLSPSTFCCWFQWFVAVVLAPVSNKRAV
ncbi:hypothetical protein BJ508DRAFT_312986 [Ascobolus immersus RN42]|uniref:Uncharacterized protein n=1 Tax=Ascobolus immersus RN42 TaxID=1160509 RepID=A0A3N4HK88_ASCIM|nr:hypothetical protein BJ508DRAFT_312986 [Ascobolus immersus RN42]